MKRRILTMCLVGFVATVGALALPSDCDAARQFDTNVTYYICPVDEEGEIDATMLSECEEIGTAYWPCVGTVIVDGTITGANYKTHYSETCYSNPPPADACFAWWYVDQFGNGEWLLTWCLP